MSPKTKEEQEKLNIVFVEDLFGFPYGSAGSDYIRLLSKGLLQAGNIVEIVIPVLTEEMNNPINHTTSGEVDGIKFYYTAGTPIPSRNPLFRKGTRILGKVRLGIFLAHLNRQKKIDYLILYSHSYKLLCKCQKICKRLKIPLLIYLVEWYENCLSIKPSLANYQKKFYSEVFQRVDAAIVISHYLAEKAKENSNEEHNILPILELPILTDIKSWDEIVPVKRARKYILYCASFDQYLRDVLFVIRAFSLIKNKDVDLLLFGRSSSQTRGQIASFSDQMNVSGSVIVSTGFVVDAELKAVTKGALALLAPLHEDEISIARFPFKIAGYLSSEVPVVSCNVGEVARFLEDRKTAFLSYPDDVEGYSLKIEEALSSQIRERVGKQGRLVAMENFDCFIQGGKLSNFLKNEVRRVNN